MSTHDPRRAIEDMRDQLAAHDRPLLFLLGAGTSTAVDASPPAAAGERRKHQPLIPGIEALTEVCGQAVCSSGTTQETAWRTMLQQCETDGLQCNVESMLSKVRMKIDAMSEGESLVGLSRQELLLVEELICTTIAEQVNPDEARIPGHIPHDDFAAWVKRVNRTAPLELFTTNYDLLLEKSFDQCGIPVFDGFVGARHPFFYAECVDDDELLPPAKWVRLWKLHGSVNWKAVDIAGSKRIVRGDANKTGEMILPSHRKYDESRKQPYLAYMDRLSRMLNRDHSLLFVCGYSFRDEHINALIFGALDSRTTANVVALQFEPLTEQDDLVLAATRRANLSVLGPNGAVISGIWGEWQLAQPVDARTCSFMDLAFDSKGAAEDTGSPAARSTDLEGSLRLGDFNWFCRFLNAMGGENT